MCEGSNNLISSITPFRKDLRVKARVVRLWSLPSNCYKNSPPSNRIEMILCDSQARLLYICRYIGELAI
ncbi:uncharacterized protein G2W53_001233 [Senna tora]|uniref:Uncharacterized protein n=1 Tax=Senna tora TaxID=362788 RepID=A0A834XFH4_9FABA|nr:uncharacterized protein G2W53_001233 [Senna tora]